MLNSLKQWALPFLKIMKAMHLSLQPILRPLRLMQKKPSLKSSRIFSRLMIRQLQVQKNLKILPLHTSASRLRNVLITTSKILMNRPVFSRKNSKKRFSKSETILQTAMELSTTNSKQNQLNLQKCSMKKLQQQLPHTRIQKTNLSQMQRQTLYTSMKSSTKNSNSFLVLLQKKSKHFRQNTSSSSKALADATTVLLQKLLPALMKITTNSKQNTQNRLKTFRKSTTETTLHLLKSSKLIIRNSRKLMPQLLILQQLQTTQRLMNSTSCL